MSVPYGPRSGCDIITLAVTVHDTASVTLTVYVPALIADSADLNRLVRSPVFDADEQLKPKQDASSYIRTVIRISRLPVTRASTVADKHQGRKDNAANNNRDAYEFQRLGKLINVGMDLLGQFLNLLNVR